MKIKSENTGLELRFRRALWAAGVRGWRCHIKSIVGKPDVSWPGLKIAVFLASAWWHGHPSRWQEERYGEFWDTKIRANKARDEMVTATLLESGWAVLRYWDFEVERQLTTCIAKVSAAVADARKPAPQSYP